MKVLHLLFTDRLSGAEKVVINIIENSKLEAYYCSFEGQINSILDQHNINFISLQRSRIYQQIRNICKEYEIDIVHAHDFKASIIASYLPNNIKVFSHLHQNPTWIRQKNLKSILYKSRIKRFFKVISVSKNFFNEYVFSIPEQKKVVLPNFIPSQKEIIKKYEKKYDVIFLGRLEPVKNPLEFLEIFNILSKKNPGLKGVVLGTGSLKDRVGEYVESNSLDIELVGFVDNPTKYILMSKVMLVTSIWEGFSLAAAESLQMGVPVITYDNGGIADFVNSTNGAIVNSRIDMVERTFDILNNKYQEMENDAKNSIRKFSDTRLFCERLSRLYGV